jgi:tRNA 5-methylaminomethyl-2-thiouridine biosynthesis bifunctional protein
VKSAPVVPAQVERDADGLPYAPRFDDRYHPRQGALAQARQVFLEGNGLPVRWRGRDRFVVLETGFGLGNNFLATWKAWREDASRCARLHFVSIEAQPLRRADLAAVSREPELADLALALDAAWPPLTFNLHRLAFDEGRVELLLAFGDISTWLPQIDARVDAFFLDGFAPAKNPQMWEPRLFKAMARIAGPEATVATWSAARAVRDGLSAAGFDVGLRAGSGGKRDITTGRFAPRFTPRPLPRRGLFADSPATASAGPVAIVGAGLAGCAVAAALASHGRSSVLFERNAEPAREGSGNAAGLFHGVVHRHDGPHARFHRAAALAARQVVAAAMASHGVRGRTDGLLRLETGGGSTERLHTLAASLGLPPDYVRAVSATEASTLAGLPIAVPAWFFAGGGWVDPRALSQARLDEVRDRVALRCSQAVAGLRRSGDRWQLLDPSGVVLADAEVVVLANAGDAQRLLGASDSLRRTRGQISGLDATQWPPAQSLHVPVAGGGYLLPPIEGRLWFGATSQEDDTETDTRRADHAENVARLAALMPAVPRIDPAQLVGRVGFRWSTPDRLPLVGAVPAAAVGGGLLANRDVAQSPRPDQPRFAPRAPGLFVLAGLGSRGIAGSALGAQVIAAWISGAPMPLEADLLDAIDPARFASRAFRRRS